MLLESLLRLAAERASAPELLLLREALLLLRIALLRRKPLLLRCIALLLLLGKLSQILASNALLR